MFDHSLSKSTGTSIKCTPSPGFFHHREQIVQILQAVAMGTVSLGIFDKVSGFVLTEYQRIYGESVSGGSNE